MINKKSSIFFLYLLFSLISIFINILTQYLSMFFYRGFLDVEISILLGTLVSVPFRYIVEKTYIFNFKSTNLKQDSQIFVLYLYYSIITTLIFWFIEYCFYIFFSTNLMRYVGGILGLSIGFFLKYQLDKKYVFIKN